MITSLLALVCSFVIVRVLFQLRHLAIAHKQDTNLYKHAYVAAHTEAITPQRESDSLVPQSDRGDGCRGQSLQLKFSALSANASQPSEGSPASSSRTARQPSDYITRVSTMIVMCAVFLLCSGRTGGALASSLQETQGTGADSRKKDDGSESTAEAQAIKTAVPFADAAVAQELRQLKETIELLEARVRQLEEERQAGSAASTMPSVHADPGGSSAPRVLRPDASDSPQTLSTGNLPPLLWDASINLTLDGYYGYNFNRPLGRVNLLRAYDVSSNSFSLNQATLVIELAPNLEAGRRFGARLDLMYGQATETVQGNAANELRPQVYRPVWQAYGTYVAPVGNGLTLDFLQLADAARPFNGCHPASAGRAAAHF